MEKFCRLTHCTRPVNSRGLCGTHYRRWRVRLADWDAPVPRVRTETLAERFERNVITTEHGRVWNAGRRTTHGVATYGSLGWKGKILLPHRVAWELEHGPIPADYQVDHLPDCPKTCVTVDHLQLLTRSEHLRLGWQRGELDGGWNGKRRHERERVCSIDGCGRAHCARGWCSLHWQRWRRTGDPLGIR